ncbi:hypothetical protein [Lysinibacillus xylanilyticus]|uniref:Uncharacterized protein n=1 Tax=Lysinibacillus xylanilyticus TaxID=582475 RepID=A0ABT4EW13_9BACI|nr:hypothetical protein [Lysinibacillus xylanilyticus]MCY9549868.1 hypothetical protein [Lysinibacillus xylanilyticus]
MFPLVQGIKVRSHVMNEIEVIFKDFDDEIIDKKAVRGKVRKLQKDLKNQLSLGHFDTVNSKKYPKCKRLG